LRDRREHTVFHVVVFTVRAYLLDRDHKLVAGDAYYLFAVQVIKGLPTIYRFEAPPSLDTCPTQCMFDKLQSASPSG
jgi:hypothetical protein